MTDTAAIEPDARPWTLSALADEAEFDRHVEGAAVALCDRYTLIPHINLAARRMAYHEWIDAIRGFSGARPDSRVFIALCAALIAALARHRVVTFTPLTVAPERMVNTLHRFGNEVAALATGAALYSTVVESLNGAPAAEPLSALIWENAAAALRRQPEETASRFRELLRLTTPWT
jgi:hypothetical protein